MIVLCPPLGHEYTYTHATFLQLANRLARVGLAALRFDYRSTGDSFDRASGESDGFARDVRSAVEFARTLGVAHVGIVGMRLGANFVNVQPGPDFVDAAVLWDPCPTGRSFLREQRALALFAGVRSQMRTPTLSTCPRSRCPRTWQPRSLAWTWWPATLARPSGSARSKRAAPHAVRTCLRSNKPPSASASPRSSGGRSPVSQSSSTCMTTGRSCPRMALQPWQSGWTEPCPGPLRRSRCRPPAKSPSRYPPTVRARRKCSPARECLCRERTVRLGPAGLFAIETEPVGGGAGPVCIFVSVANEHRIGPGRLWVQLSRRLALRGVPVRQGRHKRVRRQPASRRANLPAGAL